ncbi:MAG TPA: hypothetical protein VK973_13725 [Arenicellales bacterium]|nr:hypothetical protein [Arenicellales bacterium]
MKWSIYILILANLLLVAWWYPPPESVQQTPSAPPLPPGSERLVLLKEHDARVPAEKTGQSISEASQAEAADEAVPVPPVPQASEALPDLVQAPPVPDLIPEPDTEPVVPPEMPGAPDTEQESEAQPEPGPVIVCLSVGPFADETGAKRLHKQLAAAGLDPRQRSESVQQPAGFWVYLSAMPRNEARAIVEDLRRRGVEDYFIGRQNFISLGIFTDRATAERRREEIEEYGYAPQVEQRFRSTGRYWLDLEAREPELPAEAQWDGWLEQYPEVRRETKPCP